MASKRCPFCQEEHPPGTAVCPKTQRRLAGMLEEGAIVDGKYRILGILGTGGMAVVYRAEQLKIGRTIALKMLLPEFVMYPELVSRVEREARAAGGVDHPNVVAIVDLGSTADHGPYIGMEFLRGEELATYLEKQHDRIPIEEAVDIARQVLGALEAAHQKGVIHRDLKPENIFLAKVDDDRVTVKVLDFGISKHATDGGGMSSLTRTGTVLGTPQFMAPEQAAGARDQDARVDVYACGTVLYAMLTNALPFQAENYNLLINEILNKPPAPILARMPTLDTQLAAIVMKAIARKPDARFPSARAMQEALVNWLDARDPDRVSSIGGGGRSRMQSSPGLGGTGRAGTHPGARRAAPRDPTLPLRRATDNKPGNPPAPPPPSSSQPSKDQGIRAGSSVAAIRSGADDEDEPTVAINTPPRDSMGEPTPTTVDLPAPTPDLELQSSPPPTPRAANPPPRPPPPQQQQQQQQQLQAHAAMTADPLSMDAVRIGNAPTELFRSNTRTPLGWEHTPGGTMLPPKKSGTGFIVGVVLLLGAIGAGAVAVRRYEPTVWNRAVNTVGLREYAVPSTPVPPGGVHTAARDPRGGNTSVHERHGATPAPTLPPPPAPGTDTPNGMAPTPVNDTTATRSAHTTARTQRATRGRHVAPRRAAQPRRRR